MHSTSGLIGASRRRYSRLAEAKTTAPTADYIRTLREKLPREFPGITFYFLPADIVTQILNFGLPAPIDVQIEGTGRVQGATRSRTRCWRNCASVPGLTDLRIQQPIDYPGSTSLLTAPRPRRAASRNATSAQRAEHS